MEVIQTSLTHSLFYQESNLVGSFRDFVTNEKQRLVQKKQQIVKKEKDNRLADLLKFSQEFKV